jgi:uncharacterized surface protein with fasciclin (FAS1) repeats
MQSIRFALTIAIAGALSGCGGQAGNDAANAGVNGSAPAAKAQEQTIGDALAGASDFSDLVGALNSAGLAETLRGAGPYTVLAPTNAAFAALPEAARGTLMQPANRDRLAGLLRHHIVPGAVTVRDMRAAIDRGAGGRAELATLSGETLTLSREGDGILIDDGTGHQARLGRADAIHANGVLHGIDAVMMPAQDNPS